MTGFVLFIAMYLIGDWASTFFNLPIPASILGLFLVLVILTARGGVPAALKEASDFLLRFLALMLVPIGVGVVKLLDPAPQGILGLEVVLVLALAVGAVLSAKIMQGLVGLRDQDTESVERLSGNLLR